MPSREPGRSPRQVFGGMLRYYREQAGLSRTELARQINKSVSLVQAIELGQRAATPDVAEDLEAALATGGAPRRDRGRPGLPGVPRMVPGLGHQRGRGRDAALVRAAYRARPAADRGLRTGDLQNPVQDHQRRDRGAGRRADATAAGADS